ncbi:hypothetical protein [Pedobacter changchengzhani]|uniref:hypothetical protein n=1 Tax=Pedobacter changchengzhani TaxID=2529274 RepID=UPI0014051C5A|nr:hypothetical protein [Pedobacter changchengzhani]
MKTSKTTAEENKATAPKGAKAKGPDEMNSTTGKDAKPCEVSKKAGHDKKN